MFSSEIKSRQIIFDAKDFSNISTSGRPIIENTKIKAENFTSQNIESIELENVRKELNLILNNYK